MPRKSAPASRHTKSAQASLRSTPPASSPAPFPIVGIGASAGGLEALEQFLRHVRADSGMAFVIIQHLDPTRKGIMPELLQRATPMRVAQVKDRTRVRPNCVYVIPPNRDMALLQGTLHLLVPAAPRGLRLPIDSFFRSLALEREDRGIAVILSGMGADGTLGLRAIKERAGLALVQDPDTAKFDGMPRSAIDAGLADIVAPADELPARIEGYLQRTPLLVRPGVELPEKTQGALEKAVLLLRAHTGHDFSFYKRNTLHRRIERRMGIHRIDTIAAYIKLLQGSPQELDLLFKELLIGVTSFFRDPEVWAQLVEEALPELLAGRPPGHTLRAWVPGCSTGEEAYSLAIAFKEALAKVRPGVGTALQVFATDLDRDAIDKARQGLYPETIAADMAPERLQRYFVREERGYRVRHEIREMVIFAPQNLIMDPPFTKLDLLSCRNLMIYLVPELQKKLIPLFHYSLNPGGLLLLGNAETAGGFRPLFAPCAGKARLYRRREPVLRPEPIEFPTSFTQAMPIAPAGLPSPRALPSLQAQADQLILQRFAPATVLVGEKGDILYISGRTGRYLEPAAGKANWNVFAMAREGLRHEIASGFKKALRQEHPVLFRGLAVQADGGTQHFDLSIQRLTEPPALQGLVLIVFSETAAAVAVSLPKTGRKASASDTRTAELELELQQASAETQTIREEMQTSQEELRSANEELQSTNEELQSANEELTTSKEEMQSLNEELQTVNNELQAKVDDLSRINNDMTNLLNSTSIATVFLDNDLQVRRFTTQATKIIKLIPGDVGRPITDLSTALAYPELAGDAREVLRTLCTAEKSIAARDGRWFEVRIMPYRTMDNRIDGVVITFTDITVAKTLEAKLRSRQTDLEKHVAAISTPSKLAKNALPAKNPGRGKRRPSPGGTATTG
jgi:two-component system CheB/CheR fusion protein